MVLGDQAGGDPAAGFGASNNRNLSPFMLDTVIGVMNKRKFEYRRPWIQDYTILYQGRLRDRWRQYWLSLFAQGRGRKFPT